MNPISKNDNEYTSNLNLGKYKIENILIKAPIERLLKKGKPHAFTVESNELDNVFLVVDEEEWIQFNKTSTGWNYTLNTKTPGTFEVVAKMLDGTLLILFEYEIE